MISIIGKYIFIGKIGVDNFPASKPAWPKAKTFKKIFNFKVKNAGWRPEFYMARG